MLVQLHHDDPKRGRWVAASTDISAGTLVMESNPYSFVLSPTMWTVRCQVCFRSGLKLSRCSRCRLVYYCSKTCQLNDWQSNHKAECSKLHEIVSTIPSPSTVSDILLVGRVLRKEKKCEQDLHESEPHLLPSNMVWFEEDRYHVSQTARFAAQLELVSDSSTSTVEEMLCRFHSNNFTITDELLLDVGAGCYPWAAMINHSCSYNCVITYEEKSQKLQLRAIKSIANGEEITQPYIDVALPRVKRQQVLQQHYHFECDCSRCTDCTKLDDDIDIYGNTVNHSHPTLQEATALCEKASRLESLDDAIDLYEQALSYRKSMLSTRNISILEILSQLLTLYIDMGNLNKAVETAQDIYIFYQHMYESNHALVGLHLYTLGDLECQSDSFKAMGIVHLREALRILTITHGGNHSLTKNLLNRLQCIE